MTNQNRIEELEATPIERHLKAALEETESETAKFHLREAYQKYVITNSDTC
jgi:histone H3/H4